MNIRLLLLAAIVVVFAMLMPVAFLGAGAGLLWLRDIWRDPKLPMFWRTDLETLLLGLGGVVGFFAFLLAELAPRRVLRRNESLRLVVQIGLASGSAATLYLGALFTDIAFSSNSSLSEWLLGLGFMAFAFVGYWSFLHTRNDV